MNLRPPPLGQVPRSVFAWANSACAGIAYALIVFLIGFVFGTIRVLFVAPRLGETTAVLLEAPVMLFASWNISRWCTRSFAVRGDIHARAWMGVFALTVLIAAELGISAIVFGRSASEHFSAYGSLSGAIGLVAQLCFAGIPVLQLRQA